MKSIKPGRGVSAMGLIGSIVAAVFGVFWISIVIGMRAPSFFVIFGILFIVIAVAQGIFHYKNATGQNRMSLFDITDQEPDPLEKYFKERKEDDAFVIPHSFSASDFSYCPYCGTKVGDPSYRFCPKCGKEIRKQHETPENKRHR